MTEKCKNCNGKGSTMEMFAYCGSRDGFGGAWRQEKCKICNGKGEVKFSKLLRAIKNIFYKGDNTVTA